MLKRNKWKLIVSSIIILLPIAAGLILWNALPQEVATHWDLRGTVNGWSSKPFSVFFMPLLLLAVHWICIAVTALDPRSKDQTPKALGMIFWVCPFVSLFASTMIYAHAFGMDMGRDAIFTVVLGLMFIVIGNLLPKCRRNYTLGIRVKWTLEDDANWNATHRFGGKVWVVGGLLVTLCSFLPGTVIHFVSFAAIIILAVIPVVYSYVYHRKHGGDGTAEGSPSSAYKRIRTIVLCVIFLGCAVLLFTGNIKVRYDDASFTLDATYYGDLTVNYADIEQIEYREQNAPGSRTGGFGSLRLQMGNYRNEEFGDYKRYAYTMCKACVVLTVNGRTLVVNGANAAQTRAIYDELMLRIDQ